MTDVDLTKGGARVSPVNFGERNVGFVVAKEVRYSDFAAADDIVKLIDIPENSFVARVMIVIKEVFNGTSPQLNVGDDEDPNGYLADADVDCTSLVLCADTDSPTCAAAYMLQKARRFYTAADTLDVEFGYTGTPTTGKAIVIAEIVTVPGV